MPRAQLNARRVNSKRVTSGSHDLSNDASPVKKYKNSEAEASLKKASSISNATALATLLESAARQEVMKKHEEKIAQESRDMTAKLQMLVEQGWEIKPSEKLGQMIYRLKGDKRYTTRADNAVRVLDFMNDNMSHASYCSDGKAEDFSDNEKLSLGEENEDEPLREDDTSITRELRSGKSSPRERNDAVARRNATSNTSLSTSKLKVSKESWGKCKSAAVEDRSHKSNKTEVLQTPEKMNNDQTVLPVISTPEKNRLCTHGLWKLLCKKHGWCYVRTKAKDMLKGVYWLTKDTFSYEQLEYKVNAFLKLEEVYDYIAVTEPSLIARFLNKNQDEDIPTGEKVSQEHEREVSKPCSLSITTDPLVTDDISQYATAIKDRQKLFNNFVWPELQKLGWDYVKSSNPLQAYLYARPGVSFATRDKNADAPNAWADQASCLEDLMKHHATEEEKQALLRAFQNSIEAGKDWVVQKTANSYNRRKSTSLFKKKADVVKPKEKTKVALKPEKETDIINTPVRDPQEHKSSTKPKPLSPKRLFNRLLWPFLKSQGWGYMKNPLRRVLKKELLYAPADVISGLTKLEVSVNAFEEESDVVGHVYDHQELYGFKFPEGFLLTSNVRKVSAQVADMESSTSTLRHTSPKHSMVKSSDSTDESFSEREGDGNIADNYFDRDILKIETFMCHSKYRTTLFPIASDIAMKLANQDSPSSFSDIILIIGRDPCITREFMSKLIEKLCPIADATEPTFVRVNCGDILTLNDMFFELIVCFQKILSKTNDLNVGVQECLLQKSQSYEKSRHANMVEIYEYLKDLTGKNYGESHLAVDEPQPEDENSNVGLVLETASSRFSEASEGSINCASFSNRLKKLFEIMKAYLTCIANQFKVQRRSNLALYIILEDVGQIPNLNTKVFDQMLTLVRSIKEAGLDVRVLFTSGAKGGYWDSIRARSSITVFRLPKQSFRNAVKKMLHDDCFRIKDACEGTKNLAGLFCFDILEPFWKRIRSHQAWAEFSCMLWTKYLDLIAYNRTCNLPLAEALKDAKSKLMQLGMLLLNFMPASEYKLGLCEKALKRLTEKNHAENLREEICRQASLELNLVSKVLIICSYLASFNSIEFNKTLITESGRGNNKVRLSKKHRDISDFERFYSSRSFTLLELEQLFRYMSRIFDLNLEFNVGPAKKGLLSEDLLTNRVSNFLSTDRYSEGELCRRSIAFSEDSKNLGHIDVNIINDLNGLVRKRFVETTNVSRRQFCKNRYYSTSDLFFVEFLFNETIGNKIKFGDLLQFQ